MDLNSSVLTLSSFDEEMTKCCGDDISLLLYVVFHGAGGSGSGVQQTFAYTQQQQQLGVAHTY